MIVQGKDLLVYVQGDGAIGQADQLYPIACDKTCTMAINMDMIETTTKDNGYFRTYLPTLASIQVTGDGLIDYSKIMGAQSLQSKALNRQIVSFKLVAQIGLNEQVIYTGQGYLRAVSVSGSVDGAATFSYEIIGTGQPDIDNTVPVEGGGGQPVEDMAQVYPLQFIATQGQKTYQNDALIGATLIRFTIQSQDLYKGSGDYQMTGLNSTTGTLTWNYEAEEGNECIITYKK